MPIICNDNTNGCFTGPYYPRPIFQCCSGGSCGGPNTIVNPTRSEEWGFFVGEGATVAQNQALPLTLNASAGTAVTQSDATTVGLTAGSYQVSFNVTASSATNPMEFALELNGTVLPYSIVTATGDSTNKTLSNSVIISVPTNATLRIVNLTAGNATATRSNLAATKLLT